MKTVREILERMIAKCERTYFRGHHETFIKTALKEIDAVYKSKVPKEEGKNNLPIGCIDGQRKESIG